MSTKEDKVKAFNSFDFESDRGWLAHRANIELPSTNEAQALLKVKAKWFKRTQVGDHELST